MERNTTVSSGLITDPRGLEVTANFEPYTTLELLLKGFSLLRCFGIFRVGNAF